MKWIITLEAAEADIDRLVHASIPGIDPADGEPRRLLLTHYQPDGATPEEEPHIVQDEVEALVNRLNGVGRVRWSRVFEGVSIHSWHTVADDGEITERIFLDAATGHLPPKEFADLVESLGYERPPLPDGLDHIDGLDLDAALETTEMNPAAGRVVQLIDLMLKDEEFNWSAAYAALETIEHELREQGVDGRKLGWWTRGERSDFRATANSPEALGVRARHGRPTGLSEARMSSHDANWFVRRVAALWLSSSYGRDVSGKSVAS
ncbi:MAG TPA: hypothetical protein VFY75_00610 [Solirubrobacterales bacterium]|nr:hypothetical protein [Solirubrobacterales bacterium]